MSRAAALVHVSRVLVSRGGDEANLSARYLDCGGDKYGANVGFGIVSFVEPGTGRDYIDILSYHRQYLLLYPTVTDN